MTESREGAGRRVVLHLGMLKTGSTSIQAVFSGYRDARIEYADLGLANHSLILQRCFAGEGAMRGGMEFDPGQRDAARRKLAAVLEGTGRSVILSAEGLYRLDAAGCRRCAEFLRARVSRVEALIYVRSPAGYARSVFQERLKWGAAGFDLSRIVPPYRERARTWGEALGAEPTHVMFDRASLHEGDVVADFAWRLGLDPVWTRERQGLQNRNASLSAEATAALYLLRHRRGAPDAAGAGRRRIKAFLEMLQGFGTRRFDFAPEVLGPVLEARARDIAWMEERLGRSFPAEAVKDPVVFGSEGDILAYAEAQAPALEEYLRGQGLVESRAGRSTLDLLELVEERRQGAAAEVRHAVAARRGLGPLLRAAAGRIAGTRR